MGVSVAVFLQLAELGTRIAPPGASVMLGRQSVRYRPLHRHLYRKALKHPKYEGLQPEDLLQDSGHAERMFDKLGFGAIQTMDFSAYEGAQIIHDLNRPVPDSLHDSFEFIFDGGTLEHVFNVPQAFENVFHMLRAGGTFVSATPFNGWPGHGFYQFQPDLVWSFWKHMAGCEVVRCIALPNDPADKPLDLPDNKGRRKRREYDGKIPAGRVFIYYEVRKLAESRLDGSVLQADYETKWQEGIDEEIDG